jgi:ribosomal protein S18 acetylase RimI-like enzyme
MYDGWLRKRATDDRSVFLVAEIEPHKLAGFLVATVEHDIPIYRVGPIGFIHDVWVEEGYRHEGLARQMVMLAVERFRELSCQQIRLETAECNESARSLFRTCGFRTSTIEMLHDLNSQTLNPEP